MAKISRGKFKLIPETPAEKITDPVENFKSAVIRIRDIFRSPGMSIVGMDSMQHICLYLISRYITREKTILLDIPDKFAWENLIDMMRTKSGGLQFALDYFYHTEAECLIQRLDRIFETQDIPFKIKNLHKHKEIMEILDTVDMEKIDCQMDILGWVYEQHLKTGAGVPRDLGQFFTDRFVCEYMTDLCKPGFKSPGVPESVCDPTMGTGGFLTSYVKFYKKNYPEQTIDWSIQQREIHGCDTDSKVSGIARLNLFMELKGICTENLKTHNSLYDDLPQTGYDIILANMPFGIKCIKHAECCERVNKLKIRGTKSEPLFLQLMMVSLNRGGRCAVVVPDGVLVNSSVIHNGTRKYLLDNFELRRVVKMKGKFFTNTGIQPSILFFENTGKSTETVEFWEVNRDDKNEIIETLIVSVPREKISKTFSLDMKKYMENENESESFSKYPIVELGSICDYKNGKTLTADQKSDDGEYDVMGGGTMYNGKTNAYNREGETVSISKSGASAGFVSYHSKKYWAGDCFTVSSKNPEALYIKFLYYWLKMNNDKIMSKTTGTTIPHCKWDDIRNFMIILPPISIQQQIVSNFDLIYNLKSSEIIETLKGQMAAIMKSVKYHRLEVKELGKLYEVPKILKKFNSKDMDNIGDIPFYSGKWNSPVGTHSEYSYESDREYFVIIKDGGGDHTSDTVGLGKIFIVKGKCAITSQNSILIFLDSETVIEKYVYYYMTLNVKNIRDMAKYSINLGHISIKDILTFPIPIPPISVQRELISRLDALQSQISALEDLQRQSEGNARFILDSYLYTQICSDDSTDE